MRALEKLRESSHLDDSKWTFGTGEVVTVVGHEPSDPDAVNWGEQWRKIADEIEAEVAEEYMKLPKDADGVPIRVADHMEYDGDEIIVAAVTPARAYWWTPSNDYGSTMTYKEGKELRRYKDPLKELLRTFYLNARDVCDTNTGDLDEECKVYAERIRELMEVDR